MTFKTCRNEQEFLVYKIHNFLNLLMNKLMACIAVILLFGCASQKQSATKESVAKESTAKGVGDTRTKEVEFIDENTYLLTEMSKDKLYGYDKSDPVKVGGGPINERRFLNALLGPNGEPIVYVRTGSCCVFATPNGMVNNAGMLDTYRVTWKGGTDTLMIYMNMYDKGDLKIPFGLKARTK